MPEQQNIEYKLSWHDDYRAGFMVLQKELEGEEE